MSRYQPPFTLTVDMLNKVVEIGELMGHWAAQSGRASPLLRKENRIRTIQASLAIEHNSLTRDQVTAVMEGKRVLAPEKDIQEVRNAILAYEKLPAWKPSHLKDLLDAHHLLMAGLVDHPGQLRCEDVGVYRGKKLVHMAPPASQVPRLIDDLLHWIKNTDIHPLIASAVFHYEFEFIHPFLDGNGRMGRLWQTVILSKWRSELAWLPIETLIHFQQTHYYKILGQCDKASDCTPFVEFMLKNMIEALREGLSVPTLLSEEMSEEMSEETDEPLTELEEAVIRCVTENPQATAKAIAEETGVSGRTIERQLRALQQKGKLQRIGPTKGGFWRVITQAR